jgi:uncharacterized iron-regulated protein
MPRPGAWLYHARMGSRLPAIALLAIAGCASPGIPTEAPLTALLPADAILVGEQHDAPRHQAIQHELVSALHARGALAALALEMAPAGSSTQALPRNATEVAVKSALDWNNEAWPWIAYGPTVMAAVRAGVPVVGANLPRARMREAMADVQLDSAVSSTVLDAQRQAVRSGHCDLLPEAQIGPMTRVQIARDRAMAQAVAQAATPGKTVLLVAGAGHVDERLGIPLHLPAGLRARSHVLPPQPAQKDYCAELRRQLKPHPVP